MKYYENVPENLLLLRFVATRFCNFRCAYCYLTLEKRELDKTMFSERTWKDWAQTLDVFKDRHVELYFTGGEPTLCDDFICFLKEMLKRDYVHSVRIDSNLSMIDAFMGKIKDSRVKFLASFHPTHFAMDKFLSKAEDLRDSNMLGLVNIVASRENVELINMSPHAMAEYFENRGIFLNVAKDFHRGLRFGYNAIYREYIDKLQHPLDNIYMNMINLNKGMMCGPGKHYITLSRHGNIYSCGGKSHGNLFNGNFKLPSELVVCEFDSCPSIISYSFSSSNDFSPTMHLEDYVERNRKYRQGLSKDYLDELWRVIKENDLMPKEGQQVA